MARRKIIKILLKIQTKTIIKAKQKWKAVCYEVFYNGESVLSLYTVKMHCLYGWSLDHWYVWLN